MFDVCHSGVLLLSALVTRNCVLLLTVAFSFCAAYCSCAYCVNVFTVQEDASDMMVAWEILDSARVIFSR